MWVVRAIVTPLMQKYELRYLSGPHCRWPDIRDGAWGTHHVVCGKPVVEGLNIPLLEQGFEPSGNQSPLRDTHNHLELARVMRMMQKLPETYRRCLILRYVEGLEPSEIGAMLEESSNVISVRIHRGLKELQSLLSTHA